MTKTFHFYIRYTPEKEGALDLKILGESLIGFSTVLPEVIRAGNVQGDIEIKTYKATEGCIIFDVSIWVSSHLSSGFLSLTHILEFAQFIGGVALEEAQQQLGELSKLYAIANEAAKENPIIYDPLKWLVEFIITGICVSKIQKSRVQTRYNNKNIPARIAKRLHRIVRRNYYKKALKPFVESQVKEIAFSGTSRFDEHAPHVSITHEDFGNYLGTDQEVLSTYKNGDMCVLTGSLVGLQSSKGDSMRFRVDGFPKKYRDLIAFPPLGKGTEDFKDFYKEKNITVRAEIVRESLYQKPRIIIHEVNKTQIKLL